jgi:hypothetical protein
MKNMKNYMKNSIKNSIKNYMIPGYWFFMKQMIQIYSYINSLYNYIFIFYQTSYNIYIIKDSKIIHKFRYSDEEELLVNYDYLIYKTLTDNDNKTLISQHLTLDDIKQKQNMIEPCNFEFIFVTIKIKNKNYDITKILKNNNYYYYVNNNILFTENFMNWLFFYHLKIKTELDDYCITFLDHNANELTINNTQSIKLYKNNYEIITK